jgi:hypothetical protein
MAGEFTQKRNWVCAVCNEDSRINRKVDAMDSAFVSTSFMGE